MSFLETSPGIATGDIHYDYMPMHYTANLNGCKNDNFQSIFLFCFLIFAQNINYGYTLGSNEYPQFMF